ncbi:Txe/YoeB family addiction module toxin [Exiguobacterium artemiae]
MATGRQKKLKRINTLIEDVKRNGNLSGMGKPEALKGIVQGFYSRRIDSEHRLVYRSTSEQMEILQCRYHY